VLIKTLLELFGVGPKSGNPKSGAGGKKSKVLLRVHLSQCGAGDQVDTRKLGQWLKHISGRLYDGHRIVPGRADKHDKFQRWTLTKDASRGNAG
jgi:hypothetical protein